MPITLNTTTSNVRLVPSTARVSTPAANQATSPLFGNSAVLKSENIGAVSAPVNYTPTRAQLLTQASVGALSQSSGIDKAVLSLLRQDSGQ